MKILFAATTAMLLLAGCDGAGDKATPAATNMATPASSVASATDWTTTVVETPEGGMRMGNPDAPVKIVEFASMTCHVCRDFAKDSAPALEQNYIKTGKVSFEFRNFVRDQVDVIASLLARCAGPGPFFKLTEQMFTDQDAMMTRLQTRAADLQAAEALPGAQTFIRVAEIAGLDKFVGMRGIPAAKANACLTDKPALDRLVAINQAANRDYKIAGTPTFLINGKQVTNATAWEAIEPKIKAALGS